MGAPLVLWDESAAFDQVKALLVAACPEVEAVNIYRARPAASPGRYGPASIVVLPLTPVPEYMSNLGAESDSPQRQRWKVAVTTAAAGDWDVTVLGVAGTYTAGGGDTAQDIADGLRTVVDGLGVAVTTQALAPPPAAFGVLGDTAGVSLGVTLTPPAGGARTLTVVDDNVRRAVYNWGVWRVRIIFRDVPSSAQSPLGGVRSIASTLAERVRLYLQASSLPVTNGLAYPYFRDNLQAAPARLSWMSTAPAINFDEVEGQTWTRAVALDVAFQTPVALTHDVPSLDAMGLAAVPVIS